MLYTSIPSCFALTILGQDIVPSDLAIVGLLVILEGLLSIDNALVLGMLTKRLPKHLRSQALCFGLVGAMVFRILAILLAGCLLKYTFVKFIGGAYLVFIAAKHLVLEQFETGEQRIVLDDAGEPRMVDAITNESLGISEENIEIEERVPLGAILIKERGIVHSQSMSLFWKTVVVIELTDIAFAMDSILAALALAGSETNKLWVVITGGILGLLMMRCAAVYFICLIDKYPRFEVSAYLLVAVIGLKLLADWAFNSDWSFNESNWFGAWQPWFESLETNRLHCIWAYEDWLRTQWPMGHSVHKPNFSTLARAPHLLDFHDFRRPECSVFWLTMASCFLLGFAPRKSKTTPLKVDLESKFK